MFDSLRKLLPTGIAFRAWLGSNFRNVLEGISPEFERVVAFIDEKYNDSKPETTTSIESWERELGVFWNALKSDDARRSYLCSRFVPPSTPSLYAIQQLLDLHGFSTLTAHECWSVRAPTWTPYDPRNYTTQPLVGLWRCGVAEARCGASGVRCNRFLANEPGYIVAPRWSGEAPPRIPDDSDYWPYFVYISAATFGVQANVPSSRRKELEWILRQYIPARYWIVLRVNWTIDYRIFTSEFTEVFL